MARARAIRFLVASLALAVWLVPASARQSFAGDATITTDPVAAAIMPKAKMGAILFRPSFIMPLARVFSFELPLEMQPPDRYPTPGLASRTPQRPENVLITVPPSNSVFPRNSIVTLGWLPAEQEIGDGDAPSKVQFPIRYEIYVIRHDTSGARLFVKARNSAREYTYLYKPPAPGRYTWHVRAIYDAAMHGHNSEERTFLVLP
ncbi:MAG: hypothetical protein LBS30_03855 [Planctomycetota bacterium]|jgi:hypothetical protein|nr:hypothetical protein [Planctomycetota bacterium]